MKQSFGLQENSWFFFCVCKVVATQQTTQKPDVQFTILKNHKFLNILLQSPKHRNMGKQIERVSYNRHQTSIHALVKRISKKQTYLKIKSHKKGYFQYRLVFFMILRNSSWLISPSPSLSASSIISWSSSSVKFSPSSLATLFRFLKLILPVSSSSNSLKMIRPYHYCLKNFTFYYLKAFNISSLESFSAILIDMSSRKSS